MALWILKVLARGLVGRLLGYAAFALGFWLLFQGVSRPSPLLGVLGGAAVLGAMYMMVLARRGGPPVPERSQGPQEAEGGDDSLDGSGPGR